MNLILNMALFLTNIRDGPRKHHPRIHFVASVSMSADLVIW